MRYYLDTNILVFLRTNNFSEIARDIREILQDYENLFYTSSECVHELIHLCQIGKVSERRGHKNISINPADIVAWLDEAGIEIKPVTKKHLQAMAELPLRSNHHDPFDRIIIAQAIADGVNIITSDRQFANYQRHGLKLTFNNR